MRSFFFAALATVLVLAAVASAEPRRSRGKPSSSSGEHHVDKNLQDMVRANKTRNGKVLSLFNVITFDNEPCTSTSSISGGTGASNRNGTCYTDSECRDKSGTAAGNCAAGFGVCCVFMVEDSGSTINQNCTYIRNPNFPSFLTETNDIMYTVDKSDDSVCSLRLDFESFTLLGIGNTFEVTVNAANAATAPAACQDTFQVTTSTGTSNIPEICGQNTGQHMYVDLGRQNSDSATLAFTFSSTAASNMRQYEIKVTQVKCGTDNPPGCLQYHKTITGRISTFNFEPTNDNHLQNQHYSICIRQEAGFCCIKYHPCNDPDSFSITAIGAAALQSGVGSQCTKDYIGIEGSSSVCQTAGQSNLVNKYCGARLSVTMTVPVASPNDVVCDCTAPFSVTVYTDGAGDLGTVVAPAVNAARSRGVCLNYMQVPCGTTQ